MTETDTVSIEKPKQRHSVGLRMISYLQFLVCVYRPTEAWTDRGSAASTSRHIVRTSITNETQMLHRAKSHGLKQSRKIIWA